jgi:succinate dehydrogenase / fumarate reductase membrane anchor subunit
MKAVTGSHSGTLGWLVQRATAVLLGVVLPAALLALLLMGPMDFPAWHALLAPLWLRVLIVLTGLALAVHAWIGLRDLLIDYVPHFGIRLLAYLGVWLTLAVSVLWLAALMLAGWGGA